MALRARLSLTSLAGLEIAPADVPGPVVGGTPFRATGFPGGLELGPLGPQFLPTWEAGGQSQ